MLRIRVPRDDDPTRDLHNRLQMAITLEFSTLPPYFYALLSIRPGTNAEPARRIQNIVGEEMLHMCLACNVMNAIGGSPQVASPAVASAYPRPLPGDIGSTDPEDPWQAELLPFSKAAMAQAMHIEEPEDGPVDLSEEGVKAMADADGEEPVFQTIGEFYTNLAVRLSKAPESIWTPNRNQIDDAQFFQGQLLAVNGLSDALQAIRRIISQGEGTKQSPVDLDGDLAHFYRFQEVHENRVLVLADSDHGYEWGDSLGVDYEQTYPAIKNPSEHDFSEESSAVKDAQAACTRTFSAMLDALQRAFEGDVGHLGLAIRHMFEFRHAATRAFETPLANGKVAGPTLVYAPLGAVS